MSQEEEIKMLWDCLVYIRITVIDPEMTPMRKLLIIDDLIAQAQKEMVP